jgi:hypothetical protein
MANEWFKAELRDGHQQFQMCCGATLWRKGQSDRRATLCLNATWKRSNIDNHENKNLTNHDTQTETGITAERKTGIKEKHTNQGLLLLLT